MAQELSSKQLQEYLRQVLNLEIQNQTAAQAYNSYKAKTNQLAIPKYSAPAKPSSKKEVSIASATWRGFLWGLTCFVICLVVGFGLAALLEWCRDKDGGIFVGLLGLLSYILSPVLRWGSVIIGVICIFMIINYMRNREKESNKIIQNERASYESCLNAYQQDQARVKRESALLPALRNDTAMLDERRRKSKELLDQFYSLDIIRPKYRSMVCVATFLEYLENERCYSLTGPDGCYNKFEEERRQGIIIDQLANISRQLDQIRRNQERLADALDDIQRNTNYLCITLQQTNAKLEAIQQDTRTAAWCSQQAAADQRAIKSYIVMRDWLNI